MNAGAHGSCIANVIERVTILDTESGKVSTFTPSELGFQYRKSAIDPDKQFVCLLLRFKADAKDAIGERIRKNEEYRWQTQPFNSPNAGSTFKNPEPAQWAGLLLDQVGAKQFREGQAAVSSCMPILSLIWVTPPGKRWPHAFIL